MSLPLSVPCRPARTEYPGPDGNLFLVCFGLCVFLSLFQIIRREGPWLLLLGHTQLRELRASSALLVGRLDLGLAATAGSKSVSLCVCTGMCYAHTCVPTFWSIIRIRAVTSPQLEVFLNTGVLLNKPSWSRVASVEGGHCHSHRWECLNVYEMIVSLGKGAPGFCLCCSLSWH